jgi:predicted dinucleotide-binding enzyme
MKIGILGSGDVAKTLGVGFLSRGHDVMLGTRDAGKLAEWKGEHGDRARVGSFAEAAVYGEVIVIATFGSASAEVIAQAGPASFANKTVMDATNPLRFDDKGPHLTVGFDDSLGEQIQRAIPNAHVVKVYNTVGAHHMVDPSFPGGPPDMFIAGNDDGAKAQVTTFVTGFGWNVIDLGGIESSRYLEPLCLVWVLHGIRSNSWNHAFKLLKK